MSELTAFVRESNKIEGILRDPTAAEIGAHEILLGYSALTVPSLEEFVSVKRGLSDKWLRRC